jgi:hypothetical protein
MVMEAPPVPSVKPEGKVCSICHRRKPYTDFSPRNDKHGDGYMSQCRECANEAARARREQQRAQRETDKDRAPAIHPYKPPKPKTAKPAVVGEVAGSRYEVHRFLTEHEADSPFRYTGAGMVVRDDLSEAARAYLSRFKR